MSQHTCIRVMVADSHPLFRLGVRSLLAEEGSLELVGEAADGEETLEMVQRLRPDVLLLDVGLRRINGLEVLNRLQSMNLHTKTVLVTPEPDRSALRTALVRGARGVLLKHLATDLLTKCVRQVMKGELWIGREDVEDLVHALRRPTQSDEAALLTNRELDIVTAVIKGASNKVIAEQLGLGEQTVKNHLRRIFAKLQVANRVELALHAMKYGLIPKDQIGTKE
ncbi:MAG TPA: response regulator transcription factor [Vicinamibacterales bacterium]|nr:response regulator transcription factor [Vicinamibacterales bacterium]